MSQSIPASGHPRAASGLDRLERLFAAVFAAIAVWSWVGITLAEIGWFQPIWLVAMAGPASLAAAASLWRRLRPAERAPAWHAAALTVVAIAAAGLSARPAEYLVDGSDGSVYVNIGRSIARHHALIVAEPVLDLIPADRREALIERERHPPRVFNLFPGGIQVAPGDNAVQPNFFHLFPVWIAIVETFAGGSAAYFVSPVCGVIAAIAFWLLARRLTSAAAATCAALLLLLNFGQMWFGRLSTTETMTEALVLTGVLFCVLVYRDGPPAVGALAGVAFGLAAFTRIDVMLLVLPIVAVFLVVVFVERRWTRGWTLCTAALAVLVAHAAAHAWLVSSLYTQRILFYVLQGRSVSTASRVVPPLVLASAAVAAVASRRLRQSTLAGRLPWIVLGVAVLAAGYRIWPQLTTGHLSLLLTPIGLAAIVAGTGIWIHSDRTAPSVLVAGLLVTSILVYGESARDAAGMPMPLRRFVPVVLPLGTLAVAALLDWLWRRRRWRAAAVLVWLTLAISWGSQSRAVAGVTAMRGVQAELARLAASLPDDAIVIADRTLPSHLALSLWGTFGRSVLVVKPSAETAAALGGLAVATPRPLVVMRRAAEGGLRAVDLSALTLSPPRIDRLALSPLEATTDRLPRALAPHVVEIEFYQARRREAPTLPLRVEIGSGDLATAIDGFHDAERMGEATARWTGAEARMLLPALPPVAGALMTLRVAAARAGGVSPPTLQARIDDVEVGATPPIGAAFAEIPLILPAAAIDRMIGRRAVLTLRVPTFVPAAHGLGADRRQLGAVVDWVRIDGR